MANTTTSIQRIFANSHDYVLKHKRDSTSHVFFEDVSPNEPTDTIAICLPGIGDTRRQFRLLAPMLVDQLHCRVLVGDLRGFGDSTDFHDNTTKSYSTYSPEAVADDVVLLVDELHASHPDAKFILIGNSLAAAAMTIATQNRASHVKLLVLLGPILRDAPQDKLFRPLSHVLFPALYGRFVWIPYYQSLYPGIKPSDFDHEIDLLKTHLSKKKSNIKNVGKFCRAPKIQSEKAVEALGKWSDLPVLAFFGRKDPDYADFDEEIKWAQLAIPQIQIQIEENGGHYPHLEVPSKVVDAIAVILNK